MYDKETGEFRYRPGAVMCNMLLADEINRTSSKTQSALLEVMEEGNVTVDGVTYKVPEPFVVIATQNPLGTAGTQMLPESQLDRFMVRLSMGYPDIKSQVELLRDRRKQNPMEQVHQILDGEQLMQMQQEAADVFISDEILEYISLLTAKTRQNEAITLGISPRGALALSRMARARAYLCDRDYVIPEDVQEIFTEMYVDTDLCLNTSKNQQSNSRHIRQIAGDGSTGSRIMKKTRITAGIIVVLGIGIYLVTGSYSVLGIITAAFFAMLCMAFYTLAEGRRQNLFWIFPKTEKKGGNIEGRIEVKNHSWLPVFGCPVPFGLAEFPHRRKWK